MIGKVGPRGSRVSGLLYYLFGPGRCEEHTDPHLIAGWRHPAELEPPLCQDGHRDFRHLSGLLQQPHDALGERGFERPVWHCSVRAAPGDRMLSDDEWAQVAGEIMHRTGLAPYGQDDEAVRWVAVRHAADHIHLVAVLARQDGTRPRLWNDYYRIGEPCHAAEHRFGLRRTAPRDRTAARRPTRAESEKARRRGLGEPPRVTLRRTVATAAATSSSEHEFFARLDAAGISVRRRFSTRNPGEVTGYAVALPADTAHAGGPVWYGGGKLAPDLTLPKLRHRWTPADATRPTGVFTAAERNAVYEHAARTARDAAQQIRHFAAADPSAAADAAWAAADTLHAAASALGNPELRRPADAYDRAARCAHGRLPRPTPTGNSLRTAGRILSAAAIVTRYSSSRPWPRLSSTCGLLSGMPLKPPPLGLRPSDCMPRGARSQRRLSAASAPEPQVTRPRQIFLFPYSKCSRKPQRTRPLRNPRPQAAYRTARCRPGNAAPPGS